MDKKDYNIISKETELIELNRLHIQYIPMAHLDKWYEAKDGYRMMSLVNSPHIEIMEIFDRYKFDIHKLMKTRYARERLYRRNLGMKEWDKEHLIKHLKTRYKTFKSLRDYGFQESMCWDKKRKRDTSVLVCKDPFWESRFNQRFSTVGGWEIFNGAGRCSAALVLGWDSIPGKFIEDAKPGTKKWRKIEKRFK